MASQQTVNLHRQEQNATWGSLYQTLRPTIRYWVYRHKTATWMGQEEDIINDIVQEALVRTWTYLRKVEAGEAPRVNSLPSFCHTVAINYGRDLLRRDCRMLYDEEALGQYTVVGETIEEVAIDQLWRNEIYTLLARNINDFPIKQREVLLIDLANRMDFREAPTALQQAFLQVGVHLADYQVSLDHDASSQNRRWALLSMAYKRLKKILSPLLNNDGNYHKVDSERIKVSSSSSSQRVGTPSFSEVLLS